MRVDKNNRPLCMYMELTEDGMKFCKTVAKYKPLNDPNLHRAICTRHYKEEMKRSEHLNYVSFWQPSRYRGIAI